MIKKFFSSTYSYWLYFLLITYFTIFFYIDIIYVKWDVFSFLFAFIFNFFWAAHLLICSIPFFLISYILKLSPAKSRLLKTIVAWMVTVLTTFPVFLFYKYYQGPPSITVVGQAGDSDFIKTTLPYFTDIKNFTFYFIFPGLISFVYLFIHRRGKSLKMKIKIISLCICLLLALVGKEIIQKGMKKKIYTPEMSPYNPIYHMYVSHNHPFRTKKHGFGQQAKLNFSKKDLKDAKKFLNENFKSNSSLIRTFDSSPFIRTSISKRLGLSEGIKPNIVFLVMESLSTFHMDEDVMPFLSNFGEYYPRSVIFENFLGMADQTVKGQHALFCGQYVTPLGKVATDYLDLKIRCLSHILKDDLGYTAKAFNGVSSRFHNKHHYFQEILKFDHMMGVATMPKELFVRGAWGSSDLSALKFTLHNLKNIKRPYLFQLMSVNFHGPFKLPEDAKSLGLDQNFLDTLPLPIQILHYDDAALRLFFEEAKKLYDYDNTIFIVTADTGGGASRHKSLSQFDLFEIRNKIPFIVFSPLFKKLKESLRVTNLASQYTVAPFILDIMGHRSDNSFIGIPRSFYEKSEDVDESNSYVGHRLGYIAKTYNMQFSYFKDNKLLLISGFNKFYATPQSLAERRFVTDLENSERDNIYKHFIKANNFWRKVYMPLLHFNQLLSQ